MHEFSKTIRIHSGRNKGRVINVPGKYRGKELSDDELEDLYLAGKVKPIDGFYRSLKEGSDAAKERSMKLQYEIERLDRKSRK